MNLSTDIFAIIKGPPMINVIELRWPIKILASEMMLGSFYFVINAFMEIPALQAVFHNSRDENLTVVANRKNISDKEAFARLLLKMYKENSFHSIKFSTDHGYATTLDMTVYSWKEDIENGESIMQIEFRPIEYGKDYDIVHNPDKYVLFIDGTEIKWNI